MKKILLFFFSIFFALVSVEIGVRYFYPRSEFKKTIVEKSPEGTFWYYDLQETNGFSTNHFGFVGKAPDPNSENIVVLGDSLLAEWSSDNFVSIAAKKLGNQPVLYNVGFGGYSLDQIRLYYEKKLIDFPHQKVVLALYIDDINRLNRYVHKGWFYNPGYPDWAQTLYYEACFTCRLFVLPHLGIYPTHIVGYRPNGNYRDFYALALRNLDQIFSMAKSRNARLSLLNIPRFSWSGVLRKESDYPFMDFNHLTEEWSRKHFVPYRDSTPLFVGKEIKELRVSDDNIHFTQKGHQLIGSALAAFIQQYQ